MSLGDRLKLARESLSKSQKEMAAISGASYRAWQGYETGENSPSAKVIEALAILGLDANWLLTGEGAMWRRGYGPEIERMAAAADRLAAIQDMLEGRPGQQGTEGVATCGDFVLVPRYEVAASAGGGAVIHSEQIVDYLSFRTDWIRNSLGLSEKQLALINVLGDSMETTLSNGDLILVDLRTRRVVDNSVYVLQLNGSLIVKRIQRKLDGSVVVMSDNERYKPETVSGDKLGELNIIGRVVWCGRRM